MFSVLLFGMNMWCVSRPKVILNAKKNWKHHQSSFYVDRLHLMAPMDLSQNSVPFFGAVAFCLTKIDDLKEVFYPFCNSGFCRNFICKILSPARILGLHGNLVFAGTRLDSKNSGSGYTRSRFAATNSDSGWKNRKDLRKIWFRFLLNAILS